MPVLYTLGSLDLLRLPLITLFCSLKYPGDAILKAYDLARELRDKNNPVICGFHTPVEKDMLDILHKGDGSVVIYPTRGIQEMRISPKYRNYIKNDQLLVLSLFGDKQNRQTSQLAQNRNRLVAALADVIKVIHC